ncbi:MAG: TM0106 family RecB-like putative nuclease, partial [Acidobacteriales bacterium]|nr:TM0106 family RecB-like putative nuclease [Terriglobales bacterium]
TYSAYYRHMRDEYENFCRDDADSYPDPVEHCQVCAWDRLCDRKRHDDDHLSLVANISRTHQKSLIGRNVNTVVDLANLALPVIPKIEGFAEASLERIQKQAQIQLRGRKEGRACYELAKSVQPGRGLNALPMPSPGDLFLDLESNPYVLDDGLEYLFGWLTLTPSGESRYECRWASNRHEERLAFEEFIATVMQRWQVDPGMHIYHYAPYEPTALKKLAGRHGTCIDELDELLRAEIFVDLYRVVRQSLFASVESYSIKKLEPLYEFNRQVPLSHANVALQSYEAAMALGAGGQELGEFLSTIEGYNRDDCFSAWCLRDWLELRRTEWEAQSGQSLTRPELKGGKPGIDLAAQLDEVAEVKAQLTEGLPPDESQWNDKQRACWLLAQMLEWHRREEKSFWWEYFKLRGMSDDELQEDKKALGGLKYQTAVASIKRSTVYRYTFPPQEHDIHLGREVRDPRTEKGVGEIVEIDDENRTIDIKRAATSDVSHPASLIPYKRISSELLSASLLRLGAWVTHNSLDGPGENQAARRLLLREPPKFLKDEISNPIAEDGQLTEAAKCLLRSLAREPSVLPIQGPPGSGKSFTAARMIVELVRQGKRVGISAVSHKVICCLLQEVCEVAIASSIELRAVQKPDKEGEGCVHHLVTLHDDEGYIRDSLVAGHAQVAAGTAWLWAHPALTSSVDVLFLDEAGQMSLANTLAICQAATSLVMLGDPQQLDQPQRGVHPPGADASALGHILNGQKTIKTSQGIFLSETRRLHPDICSFTSEIFYDGRLVARPENDRQRLTVDGPLDGTGLRFIPVQQSGNSNQSEEEVVKVVALVQNLSGAQWTDTKNVAHPLGAADILILAPYNAQVSALKKALPGSRVGTVDKFQGQEAPVVIFSMATSTPEDAPRGMEFLYSLHRLNVAVSRARCIAAVVANPALFRVQCRTPRQFELANAFCRYLELAIPA